MPKVHASVKAPPDHRAEAKQSHLRKQLQIIVVCFVYEEIREEAAKLRIDDREGSKTPAQHRPVAKQLNSIVVDGKPHAARDFSASFG